MDLQRSKDGPRPANDTPRWKAPGSRASLKCCHLDQQEGEAAESKGRGVWRKGTPDLVSGSLD